MSASGDLRCPACGALVSEDAEWCGQCFTSLRPSAPEPRVLAETPLRVATAGTELEAGAPAGSEKLVTWSCPACGHDNPMDVDVCAVCSTPFTALFTPPSQAPRVDARTALTRSLLFPGLGHVALGRGPDGLARAMLFAWTFGTAILLALSGVSSGVIVGLLLLYGGLAVAVYVFTAAEAHRLAQGGTPLVTSRLLLWFAVGLVLISVLVAFALIFAASRAARS